jgi:hypothetical protein
LKGGLFNFSEYAKKALVCQLVICRSSNPPAKGALTIEPGKRLAFYGRPEPPIAPPWGRRLTED